MSIPLQIRLFHTFILLKLHWGGLHCLGDSATIVECMRLPTHWVRHTCHRQKPCLVNKLLPLLFSFLFRFMASRNLISKKPFSQSMIDWSGEGAYLPKWTLFLNRHISNVRSFFAACVVFFFFLQEKRPVLALVRTNNQINLSWNFQLGCPLKGSWR